jgi:hypothetical protein
LAEEYGEKVGEINEEKKKEKKNTCRESAVNPTLEI